MTDSRTCNRIIPALLTSFLIVFLVISVFPLVSAGTGSTSDRTWQFNVDTSTFRPDEYLVTVSAVDEDVTTTALFNVLPKSAEKTGNEENQPSPEPPRPTTEGYYITINPIGDRHVGDTFTITGRTNLPEGADIHVSVFTSSLKPTSKSSSGGYSGAEGVVQASTIGWWASAAVVSADAIPFIGEQNLNLASALKTNQENNFLAKTNSKIIRTASVTLEVQDIGSAAGQFEEMANAQGGYLSSSTLNKDGDRHTGTVVIRVPQGQFTALLNGVKSVGIVKYLSTKGEDVTEEYVDLLAQKEALKAQLAQYYVIMQKATRISDIVAIQQQIDRVQTDLNRLEGRLKYLNDRIDLATITITLQEPAPREIHTNPGHSFADPVNRGIEGLYSMIDATIVTVVTFLPFITLAGIGIAIYGYKKKQQPVRVPAELQKER
ncbi:MAG: DUF4349 domain-containing protein [Methanoregula sp.]|nr:DUF4349 domain-containing protein [Methanoregula sp.]